MDAGRRLGSDCSSMNSSITAYLVAGLAACILSSCGGSEADRTEPAADSSGVVEQTSDPALSQARNPAGREPCASYSSLKTALFGDLHVHTSLSFDAVAGRLNLMPEDAYNYARGRPIQFFPVDDDGRATGITQLERPLDFVAVTDHAEFLGERALCTDSGSSEYAGEFCEKYRQIEFRGSMMLATALGQAQPERIRLLCGDDGERCVRASKGPWQRIIEAAEAAYDRSDACEFTTFVGYEYSGSPGQSNYHRNVIFRGAEVPETPISFFEAPLDHLLWQQLDEQCDKSRGCDYLTIPHNSNMSNGKLLTPFAGLESSRDAQVRYATTRERREPIVQKFSSTRARPSA